MAQETSRTACAIYVIATLGIVGSFVGFGVLYFHPDLRGTPHQRLILSAAAVLAFSGEFLVMAATGGGRILPILREVRQALFRRVQVYGLMFLSGFCLSTEDHWLMGVLGLGILAVVGYFMVSGRFWLRRFALFLATLLAAPPALKITITGLADIEIDPAGETTVWAIAGLIGLLLLWPSRHGGESHSSPFPPPTLHPPGGRNARSRSRRSARRVSRKRKRQS